MNLLSLSSLAEYWADPVLSANIIILLNLLGALALGSLVGYERTYRSRAAGMRTLGLVCMGSAALTVLCGYPYLWYGGHFADAEADGTTRVIQGIVTGIGFLGAGVILKDGTQISGLTTAAMIWVVAAIGILIGVGLYPAAIMLAFTSAAFTMWGSKFEARLPSQSALMITLKFATGRKSTEGELRAFLQTCGYALAQNTISVGGTDSAQEWRFVAVGSRMKCVTLPDLAARLGALPGVTQYALSYARN